MARTIRTHLVWSSLANDVYTSCQEAKWQALCSQSDVGAVVMGRATAEKLVLGDG